MTRRVAILGAGGHARVVADILLCLKSSASADIEIAGFVAPSGENWCDIDIIGDDTDLPSLIKSGHVTDYIVGIGTIRGGVALRRNLVRAAEQAGAQPFTAAHPSAIIGRDSQLSPGSAVMAGAVVNPGSKIGEHSIINTGAIIDHDCSIGAFAHIAPGSTLSGGVDIGPDTLIGTGATIRQGVTIGEGVTVGAGSVVISDLADGVTALGCPARPV